MPKKSLHQIIREFFEDLGESIVEDRAIEYIIRELHLGRSLKSIINDPYIRNRLSEDRIEHILENPDVIKTVEEEVEKAFEKERFKFFE